MHLSKFTDYAFRTLIYLAQNNEENMTVDIVAQELEISVHHLKKIIHKLGKTQYIVSAKGRNGGLKLGMDPKDINLGEVLLETEDNLNIVQCMSDSGLCKAADNDCRLKIILRDSLKSFINEMSKYTLADIIN